MFPTVTIRPDPLGQAERSAMTDAKNPATQVTPAEQAGRFARAREVQSRALLEDYVELIGDLIEAQGEARVADIAERMGVAHPTATKTIARLKREGLATSRPYRGIFLTEEGAKLAQSVRGRHRIVVDLLVALGVPSDYAERDAEGIEHHVSRRTLEAFEVFLAKKANAPQP
tara:strand:- start:1088 stop:1603 length:516 start_codon:yes stop_codon:yes gene_type:complete